MLLSLTKEQVKLLRFAVQNARAELADPLNKMDNGDMPYDDIKYVEYDRKYYVLAKLDDYLFDVLNK